MKKIIKGLLVIILLLAVLLIGFALASRTEEGAARVGGLVSRMTGGRWEPDSDRLGEFGNSLVEKAEGLKENVLGDREGNLLGDLDGVVNYDLDEAMIFNSSYPVYEEDRTMDFQANTLRNLDIRVGGCAFVMEPSPDDSVHITAVNARKFQAYTEDETLYIKGTTKTVVGTENTNCEIRLQIPAHFNIEKAEAELGAGAMDLGEFTCVQIDLKVGAGQIRGEKLFTDVLNLEVGVGDVSFGSVQSTHLSAAIGMGNLEIAHVIAQELEIDCSMGNVDLTMRGHRNTYNYQAECGMGKVTIGEDSYTGITDKKSVDNGASQNISVKCSMGNVAVGFSE